MAFTNLAQLLEKELGAMTAAEINSETSQVGVAVTRILRQRPSRVAWIIINLSPANIYLSPRPTVSSTAGILVGPSGGNVIANWKADYALTSEEWYAIADAAASAVLVVELLLVTSSLGS